MTDPIPLLETRQLSKRFGTLEVVQQVDLHIYEKDIYVLLGPNGAGKTTILSLLVGLLQPTRGSIHFTGAPGELAGFIGLPPIYAHLSARDNLSLSYRMRGRPLDKAHIDATLDLVGLNAARDRKTGSFSTGMRQRLGIARALLFKPRLIILDEPTNGLDPDGIVELREMILNLNRERGITWLISSHLLSEVEQFATRLSILVSGTQRIETTLDSLKSSPNTFIIESPEPERARAALPPEATLLEMTENQLQVRLNGSLDAVELNRRLVGQGIPVAGLMPLGNQLETLYFQICYGINRGKA